MPRCEGLPGGPCPHNASGKGVNLCQGDLMLCSHCNDVRFKNTQVKHVQIDTNMQTDTNIKQVYDNAGGPTALDDTPRGLHKVIIEPVLSYIWFSMQSCTVDNIKIATVGHFCLDAVNAAKNVLWEHADNSVIGEQLRRRATPTRSEKEAHVIDILDAFGKLDKANKVPLLAIDAFSLGVIPKHKPDEFTSIAVVDRLDKLEGIVKILQETTDKLACENLVITEKIADEKISYADIASHGLDSINLKTTMLRTDSMMPHRPQSSDGFSKGRGRGGWTSNAPRGRGNARFQSSTMLFPCTNVYNPLSTDQRASSTDRLSTHSNARSESQASYYASESAADDGFRLPNAQLKRRTRRVIKGQANLSTSSGFKGAPEPQRELFIFRVHPETETDELREYIINNKFSVRDLECVSNPNAKFKSFRLAVPASEFKNLFDEGLWPSGVRVRKYIPPRRA